MKKTAKLLILLGLLSACGSDNTPSSSPISNPSQVAVEKCNDQAAMNFIQLRSYILGKWKTACLEGEPVDSDRTYFQKSFELNSDNIYRFEVVKYNDSSCSEDPFFAEAYVSTFKSSDQYLAINSDELTEGKAIKIAPFVRVTREFWSEQGSSFDIVTDEYPEEDSYQPLNVCGEDQLYTHFEDEIFNRQK